MTSPSRRNLPKALVPAVAPVVAVVAGLLACVVAARSTGAMDPFVFVEDAGPLVRWSVPLVRVGHDVAAAVTVASLAFAASLVPAPTRSGPRMRSLAPSAPLRLAAGAGLVWAVLALVGVVLTFADAAGLPLSSPALGAQLQTLVWQVDATRIGLLTGGCAVVVATGAVLARSRVAAAWLGALGALGVMVLGLASHTGASDDHETSVDAMGLHLLGATTWVGGLVVLVVLHGWLSDRPGGQLGVTARRYSTLALVAFVTVGLSGVLAATTRLASWSDLGTPYGRLIVVKSLAFVALGLAGWWHRRRTLAALDAGVGQRAFLRLALGEVAVMGATFGVAAALSRSAPPVPEDLPDPTPALAVTGFPAPPDPSTVAWWATWRTDWLWLAVAVVLIGVYAACAVAARVASARALVESHRDSRRDDSRAGRREAQTVIPWPVGRTVSWVLGCLLLVWVTSGPLGVYGRVSFAWHTALLLVLALVVPLLLVAASPVTLAERALPHRDDGTLGPREVVVGVARSGAVRALTRPVTATVLLVGALVLLHATGLLDLALTTHPGHLLMTVAALGVGGLWAAGMVGPGGNGPSGSRTVLMCLGALDLCAFAAAAWLARTSTVLGAAVLGGLDLPWLRDLEADQRRAAGVILLVAVPVSVVLAVVVLLRSQRAGGRGR